jgi:hypothetical protein
LSLIYAGAAVTNMFMYFVTTFLGAVPPPHPWISAVQLALDDRPYDPGIADAAEGAVRAVRWVGSLVHVCCFSTLEPLPFLLAGF